MYKTTQRCCYCINVLVVVAVVVIIIENVVGGYDHNAAQIFAEKENKQCLLKYINKTLVGIHHNYYIETWMLIY